MKRSFGLLALSVFAAGGAVLHLDGVLGVRRMPMDGARMIIVSTDGSSKVVTEDLSHFTLNLKLQQDYLISFERPGCVSKQLRFNTHVPDDYPVGDGFYFPFQVTLEPPPKGQHFEYAGPVGYVHFDEHINAFGYDTDYRISRDTVLTKQLNLIQSGLDQPKLEAPPLSMAGPASYMPANAAVSPTEGKKVDSEGEYHTVAATLSKTAPTVHVLDTPPAPPSPAPELRAVKEAEPPAPIVPEAAPQALAMVVSEHVPMVGTMRPPEDPGMSKEVVSDKLHVITIIRLKDGADTQEYRRVVSYYGGTTYFCNGSACSADQFNRAFAR